MLGRRMMMAAAGVQATYRYFKVDCTLNQGHASQLNIVEVQWMVESTAHPIANMTSNSAPSPLVASASSEFDASYQAWKGFDGAIGEANSWNTANLDGTGWIKIDLGVGNEIAPTSTKLTAASSALDRCVKDFTLEGSNDDLAWTVLKTIVGEAAWSADETREYTF